jgi:hypothetical protein
VLSNAKTLPSVEKTYPTSPFLEVMDQPNPDGAKDLPYKGIKLSLAAIASAAAASLTGPSAPLAATGAAIAVELFSQTFGPPLEKRRDKWLELLLEKMMALEAKVDNFTFENLQQDETFITILLQAQQIAIRTHQEEKLEALRNAVINSALPLSIDENVKLLFLDFIDGFTPIHFRLMRFLSNPKQTVQEFNIDINKCDWCNILFPDFYTKTYIYDQLFKDLQSKGLIKMEQHLFASEERKIRTDNLERLIKENDIATAIKLVDSPYKSNVDSITILINWLKSNLTEEGYLTEFGKAFKKFIMSPLELLENPSQLH